MRVAAATLIILGLFLLHQDFWWWNEARPLVFGAMPIGLFYHAAYTAALPVVLWILVRLIWPEDPTVVSGFSRTRRGERKTNRRR
jgi:hypothetical protein